MPASKPLVTHMYTADPRAHVFEGRIYVYPSHDIEAGVPEDDDGGHFDMRDLHALADGIAVADARVFDIVMDSVNDWLSARLSRCGAHRTTRPPSSTDTRSSTSRRRRRRTCSHAPRGHGGQC